VRRLNKPKAKKKKAKAAHLPLAAPGLPRRRVLLRSSPFLSSNISNISNNNSSSSSSRISRGRWGRRGPVVQYRVQKSHRKNVWVWNNEEEQRAEAAWLARLVIASSRECLSVSAL